MKKVVVFIIPIVILLASSCKEEGSNKTESNQAVTKKRSSVTNDFLITLSAKVVQPDDFQVFYIQDPSEAYNDKQFVNKTVHPNANFQSIIFKLPKDVYPHNFRMDLGTNLQQSSVQIESLTISYKTDSYTIKGKNLSKYFVLNEGIVMNSDSLTYTLKTFKNGTSEVYDPYIVGKPELSDILYSRL